MGKGGPEASQNRVQIGYKQVPPPKGANAFPVSPNEVRLHSTVGAKSPFVPSVAVVHPYFDNTWLPLRRLYLRPHPQFSSNRLFWQCAAPLFLPPPPKTSPRPASAWHAACSYAMCRGSAGASISRRAGVQGYRLVLLVWVQSDGHGGGERDGMQV